MIKNYIFIVLIIIISGCFTGFLEKSEYPYINPADRNVWMPADKEELEHRRFIQKRFNHIEKEIENLYMNFEVIVSRESNLRDGAINVTPKIDSLESSMVGMIASEKNRKDELDFIVITDILQNHVLPHVGTSYQSKAYNLGYMVRELLDVYLKYKQPTDRDSFINKTFDLSGFLVGTIFRDLYFRLKNHIEHSINIEHAKLMKSVNQATNHGFTIDRLINVNNIYIIK